MGDSMSENIEGSSVTITEIMDFLPHRYPFLLVDRVVEMNGEQSGVGIKNVTASEPWFTGHFPENPVFPGVLIIEAIAQVSAILVLQHAKDSGSPMETKLIYFMTVDKVRFRHPVTPGDQMRIQVTQIRRRGMAYKFKGEVYVDGLLMAEGEIMAVNHDPDA
ncbi:MAG: 3-hydroxyacyl-[acyl-carrier-protein] dehydratase FabZ [Rhodobiaceae bacterium]|nr:3-hydroxyacyl-[acyl-carrier-protein] dehydratase FabZ [Rhodobiaceae bacterium]|tara:strand:+ start:482 stop:967 length:486 start_codon:yes stop_codon:yes gene_type:complete